MTAGARANNCGGTKQAPNCRRVTITASGFLPDQTYRQDYRLDCSTANDPAGCGGDYFGFAVQVRPDQFGEYYNDDQTFGWPNGTVTYRLGAETADYRWPAN